MLCPRSNEGGMGRTCNTHGEKTEGNKASVEGITEGNVVIFEHVNYAVTD